MQPRTAGLIVAVAAVAWLIAALVGGHAGAGSPLPTPQPQVSDYAQISSSTTPPTDAQCFSVGRRCHTPQSVRAAYNLGPLYSQGFDGRGRTIAIVDSFGSDTIAHDLHVFNQAFGLPAMCGEEAVTCVDGMPKFSTLAVQGSPATKAPPPKSNGTGQEDKSAWALEVSLDVETAHAIAPGANILLVTTPTAETLGVQGFPQMMNAEQYVVDHHLADVISQSFASAEEAFGSTKSLENLRHAFKSAAQNGVTVLGASGDTGTANARKTPVKAGGSTIPGQTVEWPASDPLVTGVGGTALCTDPTATSGRVVDSLDPPRRARTHPARRRSCGVSSRAASPPAAVSAACSPGRPSRTRCRPAARRYRWTTRGVPDIALQASPRTGHLVYISLPPDGNSGLICGAAPCSTGWYDIGGTSLATPQWAGLVAIAAQINGGGLGQINPALYKVATDPAKYANDYYDTTVGDNQTDQGSPATRPRRAGTRTPASAHRTPLRCCLTWSQQATDAHRGPAGSAGPRVVKVTAGQGRLLSSGRWSSVGRA